MSLAVTTRLNCQKLSFHDCWIVIVVAWQPLLVQLLPLNGGQAEKSSIDGRYRFRIPEGQIVTLERVIVLWVLKFRVLFGNAPISELFCQEWTN